jgi:acyl-CoA hydrolase
MQTNVNGLGNLPNHQLAMTLLMTPDMANFMGNVHGGAILKLLDQVAYACASRYAGGYVVTLSVIKSPFESQSMSASS